MNTSHHTSTTFNCKAIALDLDGTLTNHEKVITPLTKKALLEAQEKGISIILASGRPTYGIAPLADELGLDTNGGYILAYNGGKIVDWHTKEEIYSNCLPDDVVPEIYEYAKTHQHALLGYKGKEIVTECPTDKYVLEESRINKMPVRKVDNLLDVIERNPTKLLMTGDPEDMKKAETDLAGIMKGRMDVFRSAPFFVELVPMGIDKAESLKRLLAIMGIGTENLMSFGDGYNDISMIKLAGMGIAMENAAQEVKEAADYVTLSNEEDGVATALKKFIE